MNTYEWMRFGTLRKHIGIPMYAGDVLITPWSFVWWWPINWLAVIVSLPVAAWRVLRKGKDSHEAS